MKYFLEILQGGGNTCIVFSEENQNNGWTGKRIAGEKCWGGGTSIWRREMTERDLEDAVKEFKNALRQIKRKRT